MKSELFFISQTLTCKQGIPSMLPGWVLAPIASRRWIRHVAPPPNNIRHYVHASWAQKQNRKLMRRTNNLVNVFLYSYYMQICSASPNFFFILNIYLNSSRINAPSSCNINYFKLLTNTVIFQHATQFFKRWLNVIAFYFIDNALFFLTVPISSKERKN